MARAGSRQGTPITLVAVHTNEGDNPPDVFPDRTAENLAAYLDREIAAGRPKSYHRICDDDSTVVFAADEFAAWALRSGNQRSLNVCVTGWARWSRWEWLQHPAMLERAAGTVRFWCDRYGIPVVKLTPAMVGQDLRGVCGHHDWTVGKRDGSHTDPGPGFPWDVFISMTEGDDVTEQEHRWLEAVHRELTVRLPTRVDYQHVNEPVPKTRLEDTLFGMALNADARSYEARQVAGQAVRELREVKALLTVVTDQLSSLAKRAP